MAPLAGVALTVAAMEDYRDDEQSWIEWWCSLKGNELLCEVR